MEEILPGVWRWTAEHPRIGVRVSSHWVPDSRAVIDPLLPEDGIDAFRANPPELVLLSNRHHLRHSERFAKEFGCSIRASAPGLHEFEGGPDVEAFEYGEEAAPEIEALEVGAICPDETALLIRGAGALLVADGMVRYGGELSFVSDRLLGDDPEAVKRGLRAAYAALLDRDFDNLLFAHGEPLIGGANDALREFVEAG